MTENTDFPDNPENESNQPMAEGTDDSFDSSLDPANQIPAESVDEPPPVPEPPPEPKLVPFDYVAPDAIVGKMQALTQQKKEEAEERERLASMPKQPYRRDEPRVGRNDPCPCGSGKKYKKCHMGKDLEENT